MLKDRRLWIIFSLIFVVAFSFWTTSRYPSLDSKSSMSGSVSLQDSLSFEAVFNTSTAPDLVTKVAYTFGNWVYINWQGMTFGLILALLFMTALPLLKENLSSSWLGATFLGGLIGIPLGLCVNCSAPVAYGIYRGGGRLETALVSMLSSPSLNLVVLGTSIALLPFYLWVTKLIFSLLLIFVLVPYLIYRLYPDSIESPLPNKIGIQTEKASNGRFNKELNKSVKEHSSNEHIGQSFVHSCKWVAITIGTNSLSLCIKMIPLMLLAGLLGALLVNLLPWDQLIGFLPEYSLPRILLAMLLLAAFALFLPVPVAFDIILVATLIASGLPDRYAGILLFGLGSYSIYSFLVLLKAKLKRAAIALTAIIFCVTLSAGFVTHYLGVAHSLIQKKIWFDLVRNKTEWQHNYQDVKGLSIKDLSAESFTDKPTENLWLKNSSVTEINLFQSAESLASAWTMQRTELGLQAAPTPVFWANVAPYSAFGALSVGDINQDGWPDLIRSGFAGVDIYLNLGGHFQLTEFEALQEYKKVTVAALADIDNDGDSDLVFALFTGEKYLAYNERSDEVKTEFRVTQIDSASAAYPTSLAIADLDQNGKLDLLFGNETAVDLINISTKETANTLYLQMPLTNMQTREGNPFVLADFPKDRGATLSLLVSDIDSNNQPDIFVGNDFDSPDLYYEYDPKNGLASLWPEKSLAEVTRTTMSIDSADIDNDLNLELYLAQVSIESPDNRRIAVERQASVYEQNYGRLLYGLQNPFGDLDQLSLDDCPKSPSECEARMARSQINAALRSQDLSKCSSLSEKHIWPCAVVTVHEIGYRLARIQHRPLDCENLGESIADVRLICEEMALYLSGDKTKELYLEQGLEQEGFPQNSLTNILLTVSNDAATYPNYTDITEQAGLEYSGWSWNSKFADLDGDQWQDLFVANGWYQMRADTSNVFFRNEASISSEQGLTRTFEIQTESSGLIDYDPTISSVYLDVDLDGDLDLVTLNIFGEMRSYLNQSQAQYIQIELNDQLGNRAGIGAKVTIFYTQEDRLRHQLREIKLSGGYLSFDQPIAHFGLGENQIVDRVEINLVDGREYVFYGEFLAGKKYRLNLDARDATVKNNSE